MSQAIEEAIFPAISLIFLLLGVVLLASILFSAFNPYDQIAFANTEKLRASMEEACFKGDDQSIPMEKLDFQQNIPPQWANAIFTILPRWLIRSGGDPNYLIYYESFPAGEATGWEVYHDFQNRVILPLPEEFDGKSGLDVASYVYQKADGLKQKDSTTITALVVNNIVLSEGFRSDFVYEKKFSGFDSGNTVPGSGGGGANVNWETGQSFIGGTVPEKTTLQEKFFGYGAWKNQDEESKIPLGGNNQFVFSNYMSLTDIEKASIKYSPCGVHSLCLKTRGGVYSYPLRYCNDIKSVQLIYDAKGDTNLGKEVGTILGIGSGAGLTKLGTWIPIIGKKISWIGIASMVISGGILYQDALGRHLSFKSSDFYVTSPCSLQDITVVKTSCANALPGRNLYFSVVDGLQFESDYNPCTSALMYPIFQYNTESQKLKKIGEHYACVDTIGTSLDNLPANGFTESDKCVQVRINKRNKDYCWTPNPYNPSQGFWQTIFSIRNGADMSLAAIMAVVPLPVKKYTEFYEDASAVVLKPTQTALKEGDSLFQALDRKWWWGWP